MIAQPLAAIARNLQQAQAHLHQIWLLAERWPEVEATGQDLETWLIAQASELEELAKRAEGWPRLDLAEFLASRRRQDA